MAKNNSHWECSEETSECVFRGKKDILVVISRRPFNNQQKFKWVAIYDAKHNIKEGESLFWAFVHDSRFILLGPYVYEMGQVTTTFHAEISNNEIKSLFERTKQGKTESFNAHLNLLDRYLEERRKKKEKRSSTGHRYR